MLSHIIENVRVVVQAFRCKSVEYFSFFRFGHPSCSMKNPKICNNSCPEHGVYFVEAKCVNCNLKL